VNPWLDTVSVLLILTNLHLLGSSRSLEATWKYLLICSVGIALALLGNFFVAVAAGASGGQMIHLTIDDLMAHADSLNPRWLKAAFLFFLVG